MRIRILVLLLAAWTMAAGTLAAQAAATPAGKPQPAPQLDLAFTWNPTRGPLAGGGGFWMQGAGIQLDAQFWRGLGLAADVSGTHASNIAGTGFGLGLLTATFGPRYTWTQRRLSLYGQALLGAAFGTSTVFPEPGGVKFGAHSLALKAGGGLDLALSPHFAARLLEADWLHTGLPNGANDVQNNLVLSAGVVFRFD